MNYLEKARRVFEIEIDELRNVAASLDDNFIHAVDLIRNAVENRGKIVILGVGKSGHIGEKIAATLTSTGSPAVVLNSLNALHGDLGVISDGDVILVLSYSGETDEIINVLPALMRFDVKIITVTGDADSTMAKTGNVHITVKVTQEACPLNLAPTSSTTCMLALGDALAMVLLETRGFDKDDFAKFHPGGSLGRSLLLRVKQIMRGADQIAVVTSDSPVLEAVQAMTKHRAGAAVVTKPDGRLAGVFTHGDFARYFPDVPDIGSHKVSEFMTVDPIVISGEKLAAEALHVLETHRIDDLVVVDDDHRPIGVIDSQDLSRLKII
ncbi:MAG: KpsF/GutQ family sugar-phosphate isomerase [Chthoniobacterales bacterium]